MNTKIKTQVHTIIMLVGPSGSGKSTFSKHILIPALRKSYNSDKNFQPNVQYISSDDIRHQLLGIEADKFDSVMMESSGLAFKMLFTRLDLVTSYPINAEYVILDTTGLSDIFRNEVYDIVVKNNYNLDVIIFDYKNISEYKKTFEHENLKGKEPNRRLIANHVKRLRTEVMKTIKRGMYRNISKIRSKDFLLEDVANAMLTPQNYDIEILDNERYEKNILSSKYDWIVIGDVHGCINELKNLLIKYGFEIDANELKDTDKTTNKGLIFAGDLLDKSSDKELEETIRFIHKNMGIFGDRFQLIMGNHEEMIWKWITKHNSLEITEKRLEQKALYYNTTFLLEKNDELKAMFFDIFSAMKGWVKTIGTHKKSFIVTHAPCENKYLEKMDNKSLIKQYICLSRSKNKDKSNDEITPYLMEEAVNNYPIHIFGHLGQTNVRTFKNKVCIDTGCIYGSVLTGYSVTDSHKPFIQQIKSQQLVYIDNDLNSKLFSIDSHKEKSTVRIEALSESDQRRLNYIVKSGVCYIGGTIAPADKDEETGEFESLKSGLHHYKGNVDGVILEPKYMGSRSQMYLNRDIDKCYATSRNGYKIKGIDLTELFKKELETHKKLMDKLDVVEITFDGELMPWAAMGEGLIDKQFKVIDYAIKSEIDFLEENGFDESFGVLVDEWTQSDYDTIKNSLNKQQLSKQFGHVHNNYKCIKPEVERWQPIEKHREGWEIYTEQVKIYGSTNEPVHYKPFRILKGKKTDGTMLDIKINTVQQFSIINNDNIHVVNFNDPDYIAKAEYWFNEMTVDYKLEGCVIKPIDIEFDNSITPYMKVRNSRYLTIIYGYDMYFPKKFEKLFKQKNIRRKVNASKIEYRLGEKMLSLDINSDEFKQTVANFMFENEKEKDIDPRL